jgi:hypothetical protein
MHSVYTGRGKCGVSFGDSVDRSRHFEFALCAHTTTNWDNGKDDIVSTKENRREARNGP